MFESHKTAQSKEDAIKAIVVDAAVNPYWAETNQGVMREFNISPEMIEEARLKDPASVSLAETEMEQFSPSRTEVAEVETVAKIEVKEELTTKSDSSLEAKTFVVGPGNWPEEYRVKDIQGGSPTTARSALLCILSGYEGFGDQYFNSKMTQHPDFKTDKKSTTLRRHLLNFTFIVVAIVAVCCIVPSLTGPDVLNLVPALVIACFLLITIAIIGYLVVSVRLAWRRYASDIYKQAEVKPVCASYVGRVDNGMKAVKLLYPNGYWEMVYLEFCKNPKILPQLEKLDSVAMKRDKFGQCSVVILEHAGHRIWCRGLPTTSLR